MTAADDVSYFLHMQKFAFCRWALPLLLLSKPSSVGVFPSRMYALKERAVSSLRGEEESLVLTYRQGLSFAVCFGLLVYEKCSFQRVQMVPLSSLLELGVGPN